MDCRLFGFVLLAGCEAVLGLSKYEVEAASTADAAVAAADGVTGGADVNGDSGVSTGARRPEQMVAAARGVAPQARGVSESAAAGGGAGNQASGQDGVAGGGGSFSVNAARSGAHDDDAGVATGVEMSNEVDQMLGNTGLRVSEILGYYAGDWGQMVLRRVGDEVWGVYEYREGTIIGQINPEGVFVGWWTQTPTRTNENAGEVEFRWSRFADATIALDGRWRYGTDGDWLENWDILRVTERSAPSYLTDRFERSDEFQRHP